MTPEAQTEAGATPSTAPAALNPTEQFFLTLGAHVATLAVYGGEAIGLAFLQGFLNKRFGTNVSIQIPPIG